MWVVEITTQTQHQINFVCHVTKISIYIFILTMYKIHFNMREEEQSSKCKIYFLKGPISDFKKIENIIISKELSY